MVMAALLALLLSMPMQVQAAEGGWNGALTQIEQMHGGFAMLEAGIKLGGTEIRALRKENNDALKAVNSRIQAIDQGEIKRLTSVLKQAEEKHAPLLKEYKELGKQATVARKAKDTKQVLLLDLKRNKIKASATAARADIKLKRDTLAAAKKQAIAKAKLVKDTLAPVQSLKKEVAAENKAVSAAEKIRSDANKRYKAAVKQGDATVVMTEMQLVYNQMVKIRDSQGKLYRSEEQIAALIRTAESKLPK
jgi:colicin import membrane protein